MTLSSPQGSSPRHGDTHSCPVPGSQWYNVSALILRKLLCCSNKYFYRYFTSSPFFLSSWWLPVQSVSPTGWGSGCWAERGRRWWILRPSHCKTLRSRGKVILRESDHYSTPHCWWRESWSGCCPVLFNVIQVKTEASWDSTVHECPQLSRVTPAEQRVYLTVKTVVQLSHPAHMQLVLRKRICVSVTGRQVGE